MARKRSSVAFGVLAVMLCGVAPSRTAMSTVTITYPSGSRVQAELADTPQKRAQGLMFRKRLAPNTGMLFRFEQVGTWSFWMKNTPLALDILWIGPNKRIVFIAERVPPCLRDPCRTYRPNTEALYALEVPAGSAKREQLTTGMLLTFDGF